MRNSTALLLPLLVGVALGSHGARAAAAQPTEQVPPSAPYVEQVDVDEVLLELHAVDRGGNPVSDLRSDELQLFQDGKPVELANLQLVGAPAAALPPSPPAAPGAPSVPDPASQPERLSLVVFIDNVHVSPATRHRLLGQLWTFLRDHLNPGDRVMVAAYEQRLRMLQPFTADHGKVLAALEAAEASFAGMLTAGAAERQMLADIQGYQALQLTGVRGDACTSIIENMARQFGEQQYAGVQATVATLATVVRSLTGIEGRKAVLHVSDGIPLISGYGPLTYVMELCDGSGASSGVPFAIDMSLDPYDHVDPRRVHSALADLDNTKLWQELTAQANLQGVTFYTFEAAGLATLEGGDAGLQSRLASPGTHAGIRRNRQDTLALVATETGGRAFLDENDVGRSLGRMLADLRSFYRLSFRPPQPERGRLYRLRVETTRPDVTLRYRRSYRFRTADERVADRLLAALIHDTEGNPIGLGLEARQTTAPAKDADYGKVRMHVMVPMRQLTLLADGGGMRAGFTVYVAALRGDGAMTDVRQATRRLQIAADAAPNRSYVYEVELPLPAGEHLVGVAVVDHLGGTASFVRRKVRI